MTHFSPFSRRAMLTLIFIKLFSLISIMQNPNCYVCNIYQIQFLPPAKYSDHSYFCSLPVRQVIVCNLPNYCCSTLDGFKHRTPVSEAQHSTSKPPEAGTLAEETASDISCKYHYGYSNYELQIQLWIYLRSHVSCH